MFYVRKIFRHCIHIYQIVCYNNNMKKDNKFLGFLIVLIYGVFAITIIIPMIVTAIIFKFVFGRRVSKTIHHMTPEDFPNLNTYPVKFKSGKNDLAAYFVTDKAVSEYKAVLIVSHGIGCSRAGYLNRYDYFARKGYLVFAYDCTGTFESQGKGLKGLTQSQVDLDNAIKYLDGIQELKKYKLLAYGHSWGGYGLATELNCKTAEKLTAVATLSGFNDIWGICKYQMTRYAGKAVVLVKPWTYLHYFLLYGKKALYKGIGGVNNFKGPVLVMHSTDDKTVPYDSSVAIHYKENKNPQAKFVILDDRGHTLSRPPAVEQEIKRLHKDKKTQLSLGKSNIFEYNVNVGYEYCDKSTVFAIDEEFMDGIDAYFEGVLADTKEQSA